MKTKLVHASDLNPNHEVAQYFFDQMVDDAACNHADPLNILLQREATGEFTFHEENGVQYPHFAHTFN